MDNNSAATASVLATVFLIYGIVFVVIVAFTLWVYWRIFAKAGFNGTLSLLNLVPGIGQLICMIILAFSRWPIEDQIDALRGGAVPAGVPPSAPPGTSVTPVS
ncbi:MAG: hypothetical protein WAK16_06170 [Candidatus Cybelea sp.]